MDPTTTLEAVKAWPVQEQLEFLFRAWDQLIDNGWKPELTDDVRAELDRRLGAHQADPQDVRTWEQVVTRVKRPR
jgi:putative addiction module component (TIGR02574 family)